MHSQQADNKTLFRISQSAKPLCLLQELGPARPQSCLQAACPARGPASPPGLLQLSAEKVKPAQAAEIAAGAGRWLQANNIPCLIMPRIKLKFADALITARHSAHTASLQPGSSVQTPEEKPC